MSVPIWVNGDLLAPEQAVVSVFDHGLMVGDGVFETIKCMDGKSFALTRHLDRLALSAKRVDLPKPDLAAIADGVRRCLEAAPAWALGRIRVTYTSGPGPLGSDRGAEGTNTIIIVGEQKPFPAAAEVVVVPWPRNERGALAGVKSTSYGDNAKALAYAKERGGGEAIFENLAGNLCEGTGSNVFLVTKGRLITPTLASGCLAGVTRALTLEWCDGAEQDVPLSTLYDAEEAFLTSTTRDIQPIGWVDGKPLPQAPGPVTLAAMRTFAARSADDLDP
ncbi:aminodeoxychorismate lyase [Acrocarpospora macrocephala]|uniref:4-amino-4-deoxychorismate lyase n=1 Tax=Acrocarpospora macrocephala TaxID=150177 RepID=A0A5M3WHQ5_9ACTN|nr:aminotransferase class IV [Acrocarpospora macrocephala]GES07662.1 4-amino-4-deoxychorismate lyase [Acrocarpospora macrocephala]